MDKFSGKNQFPRINCDTPKLSVSLGTAEDAQKEGAPVYLTDDEEATLIADATRYPYGFIYRGSENMNDSTRCTVCSYEGAHEILGVADDDISAGVLVSAIGYDATEKKGIYAAATNGDWVCGVVTIGGGAGDVITIVTKSPVQYID